MRNVGKIQHQYLTLDVSFFGIGTQFHNLESAIALSYFILRIWGKSTQLGISSFNQVALTEGDKQL